MALADLKSLMKRLDQVSRQVDLIPNLPNVKCSPENLAALNSIRDAISSLRESKTKLCEKIGTQEDILKKPRYYSNEAVESFAQLQQHVRTVESQCCDLDSMLGLLDVK